MPLSDVQVRLRIEVPSKVPVRLNGSPTLGHNFSRQGRDSEDQSSTVVHHVTCRKEDRIAICHNIIIAALDFHRFVAREAMAEALAARLLRLNCDRLLGPPDGA